MKALSFLVFISHAVAQIKYNHPEIVWKTFETDNFKIHYYDLTEKSARLGGAIAEKIYPSVTNLYNYQPQNKTNIIFTDVDDISNGAAYFYDNKIVIWTSPLEFALRGSHRWLQNVITHEFAHIVSIQKSKKFGDSIPAAYFQWIGYEKEKRSDVLYGYPNILVSYPFPGSTVPPWLAEGIAQYMYPGADWDNWDSIRDMILRDQVINDKLLSWGEINTFGKAGIGNELVYNIGFALSKYIASKYGPEKFKEILLSLSKPFNSSINKAIHESIGINGKDIYEDFSKVLKERYSILFKGVKINEQKRNIIIEDGQSNIYPTWNQNGTLLAYLSNKDNDYFSNNDLYIYDMNNGRSTKIINNVYSRPSFNNEVIYYTKRSQVGNENGSRYFDIFAYDLIDENEYRITRDSRGYNPVFSKMDSSIFYLSTKDGTNNIYKINLNNKSSEKITDFSNSEIISDLQYDQFNNRLFFDITTNHFRDINFIDLSDSTLNVLLGNDLYDERQISISKNYFIYSDDRSGIFNLYYVSPDSQGYLTNVPGGAFMASISSKSKIAYSEYKNGKFNISIIDSISLQNDGKIGYSPLFFKKNKNLSQSIKDSINIKSYKYTDQFPDMFFMPRLTMDYGLLKPGFYFNTSEILNKVDVVGGVSTNRVRDFDFFINFQYSHFYPTLFFDAYLQTRNINEGNNYSVYKLDNNLRFRLLEFRSGISLPFYATQFNFYGTWSQYRASIRQSVLGRPELQSGIAYDYFKGKKIAFEWKIDRYKRRVDQALNPLGMNLNTRLSYEFSDFITGLNLSDSGTLISEFNKNNYLKFELNGLYSYDIKKIDGLNIGLKINSGFINNTEIDSFFYFFGGGAPGLKGYPYYSLEGTNMILGDIFLRKTLFKEKNINLGWMALQQSSIGLISQYGDAWNPDRSKIDFKRSLGIEFRLFGSSFYNYPTAIGIEWHRGLSSFEYIINQNNKIYYGKDSRFYLTILFGYL